MPILPTDIIPKNILTALRGASNHVQFSSLLLGVAQSDSEEAFRGLQTSASGLSEEEAARRLEEYGPNVVTQEQRYGRLKLLGRACANPLVILLLLLATVSALSEYFEATHDYRAATVMLLMVVLGVALRFLQESRADDAAAKLKAMISVTATVVRDGQPRELPLGHLGPRRRGPAGGRRHDPGRSPHRCRARTCSSSSPA